ncbi:MAG: NAD(P)-dependent oxidoreductase [Deltaproteobacteria bacterium]|nr:NAD(P)-dependent oxidoreductase [Deltaproteobacteria bacterium]
MLSGEKILMTGANGVVGLPIATELARHNEVWAIARFGEGTATASAMNASSAPRELLETRGITTRRVDLAAPDFAELPDDFTYVLHFAHTRLGAEFQRAIQVNAVGAGHVLRHGRKAKAALVVSSAAIYSPKPDPYALHHEDGDLGKASTPWAPSSPVSKVSLEAIARFCAEAFGLRTTIARLNTIYGAFGGLPVMDMDSVVAGRPVRAVADPNVHSPIHMDDVLDQLEALLDAARVQATLVNWAGDEVVTTQEWTAQAARLCGRPAKIEVAAIPGILAGNAVDGTRRRSITGPCKRPFESSFAAIYRERHGAAGA